MSPTRHFAQVDGRRVHYRRWGEGPVVLAVHGSPQSSRAVANQAAAFAARGLCVIAPDTPGNGLSDPLPGEAPSTEDYAKALIAFADELGLGRVGLYGFHTGASSTCGFAALAPGRVSAVAFDGLPCWTDEERAELLANYLTPFAPTWDGSHMAWLWARLEEQTVFFPWHQPTPAARMDYDVAPVAALHANAIDFLDAGDAYRAPYASAFSFRPEDWLGAITAPMFLGVTGGDPLRVHLARGPLAPRPSSVFETQAELIEAAGAHLAAHPGDVAPPPGPAGVASDGLSRGFASADGKALAWHGRLEGGGRPLVLLHEAGGSSETFAPALAAIGARRPVAAFDLPGHGASGDDWPTAPQTVGALADVIAAAALALGWSEFDVAGLHLGGQIAAELARTGRAKSAATLGVACHSAEEAQRLIAEGAPSLTPEWDGAHLVRAIRIARWERLFHPWFQRDRAHARPQGDLDPAAVHARAVTLLKAHERWACALRAQASYAFIAPAGLKVFAVADDALSTPEAIVLLGLPATALPADPAGWAQALADL